LNNKNNTQLELNRNRLVSNESSNSFEDNDILNQEMKKYSSKINMQKLSTKELEITNTNENN